MNELNQEDNTDQEIDNTLEFLSSGNLNDAEKVYDKILHSTDKNLRTEVLYKIALFTAQHSPLDFSEKYWKKIIKLYDSIDEQASKALMIHNMATMWASRNEINKARELWNRSILIKEKLKDSIGIAASINNLAWVAKQENDQELEKNLHLRSVKLLVENSMWEELIHVLNRLAELDLSKSNFYLCQSLYIASNISIDPKTVFFIVSSLVKNLGFENQYSPVIASAGIILTNSENDNEEVHKISKEVIIACAISRKIKEHNISEWISQQKLNDGEFVLSSLSDALGKIAGSERWLFDKNNLKNN